MEEPKMDGTMEKAAGMDFGTRGGTDHSVVLIHNIKRFVG
jgi:hypothetical protein